MAYTIVKSNGTTLTTISDGTINVESTSLGLPGRNFAGYGQSLNTNFVHIIENFAAGNPPQNPLRGQLWYDTNESLLKVCPADGETNAAAWETLTATASGGTTTFGEVSVTGDVSANNISITNDLSANLLSGSFLSITSQANIENANITSASIGNLTTTAITTGGTATPGTLTGTWTVDGTLNGNALVLTTGNLAVVGSGRTIMVNGPNSFVDPDGNPIVFAGAYGDANVKSLLNDYDADIKITGTGNVLQTRALTTGGSGTSGTITGNWTLTSGSRIQATYADLAERFEADEAYTPGTVVELGGEKEITASRYDLSEDVFGVVSDTAAYLMNAGAGDDASHPPVAVSGRVQVKVVGVINKGQRLVSAGNGMARAAKPNEATAFNTIGRALTDKTSEGEGYVEAIVMIR